MTHSGKAGKAVTEAEPEEFGALIAYYRQAHGLSQGQLARAARLSRTYVYHIETGQRKAPSAKVARALARALEAHGVERRRLAQAYTRLTGEQMEDEPDQLDLFDQRELAALLVHNTAFPAHSLDRLWQIPAWNDPAADLFELDEAALVSHSQNLLAVVFDPAYRARFRPWETLARRMLADFKHNTRSLTFLPEYRALWRSLRAMPDFTRIANSLRGALGDGAQLRLSHAPLAAGRAGVAHHHHHLQRLLRLQHRHLRSRRPADAGHLRRERLAARGGGRSSGAGG